MTTTLYYSPGACSLAVHILLEEIGQPFSLTLVSSSDGSTRWPQHLSLNPKGRVPVLVQDDVVYTEVPAIMLHLALSNPQANMHPATHEGLIRAIEWFNWLSGTVHGGAVRQMWRTEWFTTEASQLEGIRAKGKQHLLEAFALIEVRLSASTWAVEDHYSVVDAFLLVFYRWGGHRMGMDMKGNYPAWTALTTRVMERLAVQRAIATEGISVW
jgi:glutathione S-transferase